MPEFSNPSGWPGWTWGKHMPEDRYFLTRNRSWPSSLYSYSNHCLRAQPTLNRKEQGAWLIRLLFGPAPLRTGFCLTLFRVSNVPDCPTGLRKSDRQPGKTVPWELPRDSSSRLPPARGLGLFHSLSQNWSTRPILAGKAHDWLV